MYYKNNQLKKRYEEREFSPSEALWDRLEARLDEQNDIKIAPISKPSVGWWKYAAVVVLLVSAGALIWKNMSKPETDQFIVHQQKGNVKSSNVLLKTSSNSESTKMQRIEPASKMVENTEIKNLAATNKKVSKTEKKLPDENASFVGKINQIQAPLIQASPIEVNEDFSENIVAVKPSTSVIKEKKSYITGDELLFGRELEKKKSELRNQPKLGEFDIRKFKRKGPSSVRILGFTVYSEDLPSN